MTKYYNVIAKNKNGAFAKYRRVSTPYRLADYLSRNNFLYATYYNKSDRSKAGYWNKQDGLVLDRL
ncbi:hypothetical protein [Paraflavitalea sp. CAU 1676]|uniref:hypothetical protein n=1 Tax=Paraflavitalea sp. CAU 1676 TaxID=3032598 RepID=UPI0023DB08DF|nr:hypothetical protein [Paraflavitalea sp. CAU 1676]MDF2188945.1 hypothetical protein [Paraflavitalea sp. CAU 1676]